MLSELSVEILFEVVRWFDIKSFVQCSILNKNFYSICRDKILMKERISWSYSGALRENNLFQTLRQVALMTRICKSLSNFCSVPYESRIDNSEWGSDVIPFTIPRNNRSGIHLTHIYHKNVKTNGVELVNGLFYGRKVFKKVSLIKKFVDLFDQIKLSFVITSLKTKITFNKRENVIFVFNRQNAPLLVVSVRLFNKHYLFRKR